MSNSCANCGEAGHNVRTCPKPSILPKPSAKKKRKSGARGAAKPRPVGLLGGLEEAHREVARQLAAIDRALSDLKAAGIK